MRDASSKPLVGENGSCGKERPIFLATYAWIIQVRKLRSREMALAHNQPLPSCHLHSFPRGTPRNALAPGIPPQMLTSSPSQHNSAGPSAPMASKHPSCPRVASSPRPLPPTQEKGQGKEGTAPAPRPPDLGESQPLRAQAHPTTKVKSTTRDPHYNG